MAVEELASFARGLLDEDGTESSDDENLRRRPRFMKGRGGSSSSGDSAWGGPGSSSGSPSRNWPHSGSSSFDSSDSVGAKSYPLCSMLSRTDSHAF